MNNCILCSQLEHDCPDHSVFSSEQEATISRILDENRELFQALADSVLCPSCNKIARPPLANLGSEFYWAEGCEACAPKENT